MEEHEEDRCKEKEADIKEKEKGWWKGFKTRKKLKIEKRKKERKGKKGREGRKKERKK